MAQSDGQNALKRMEFQFADKTYKFALNPEEYVVKQLSKAAVVQTRGGAYIDAWGKSIASITIRGTTGFKNGTLDSTCGFQKITELSSLINSVLDSAKSGTEANQLLKFYNYTDEDYWYTYPQSFQVTRSKSKALLFTYDIVLYGLCRMNEYNPTEKTQTDAVLGNLTPISPNLIERTSKSTDDSSDATSESVSTDTTKNVASSSEFQYVQGIYDSGIKFDSQLLENSELTSVVQNLIDNASALLGTPEGYISPQVNSVLIKNMALEVSNKFANTSDLPPQVYERLSIKYNPVISETEKDTWSQLNKYSSDYVDSSYYLGYLRSPLASDTSITDYAIGQLLLDQKDTFYPLLNCPLLRAIYNFNLSNDLESMLKSLLISLIALTKQLRNYAINYSSFLISQKRVCEILENSKYISYILESSSKDCYYLLVELRKVYRFLVDISGTSAFFS